MTAYCKPAGQNTELVGLYVMDKTGAQFQSGMFQAFAIFNGSDEFIGGAVISDYRDHDCQISCAAETSIAWTEGVMRAVFTYIFHQLGCVRTTAVTKKGNRKARGFLEGLGFQLEGNLRRGYDGKHDALIYGLLASECRYLDGPEDGVGVSEGATEEASDGDDPVVEAVPVVH